MFQWKPTFPEKPGLPTEEQQQEDFKKCSNSDLVHLQNCLGNKNMIWTF